MGSGDKKDKPSDVEVAKKEIMEINSKEVAALMAPSTTEMLWILTGALVWLLWENVIIWLDLRHKYPNSRYTTWVPPMTFAAGYSAAVLHSCVQRYFYYRNHENKTGQRTGTMDHLFNVTYNAFWVTVDFAMKINLGLCIWFGILAWFPRSAPTVYSLSGSLLFGLVICICMLAKYAHTAWNLKYHAAPTKKKE